MIPRASRLGGRPAPKTTSYPIPELSGGVYQGQHNAHASKHRRRPAPVLRSVAGSQLQDFRWEDLVVRKKIIGVGQYTYVRGGTYHSTEVAVKEFKKKAKSEAVEKFMKEALLMKELHHPSIPKHESTGFNADGKIIIVQGRGEMDMAKMMDMRGWKPLPIELYLKWGTQIADALEFLHKSKPPVVHRDLKPANLLLTEEGRIVSLPTRYQAPEVHAELHYNERVDVYSFGCILYLMVTGKEPGTGEFHASRDGLSPEDLATQMHQGWKVDDSTVSASTPEPIVTLIRDCYKRNWRDRPRMDQVLRRLRNIAYDCGVDLGAANWQSNRDLFTTCNPCFAFNAEECCIL